MAAITRRHIMTIQDLVVSVKAFKQEHAYNS